MSEPPHSTHSHSKGEHGTMKSYITGFLLSLVFTAIPYYLVVEKTVSGNMLLATILGFAVLQMAVQIFFFLHLGRGPKPLYNVAFFVGTVGIILVVVMGSIFIMNNLHYNMEPLEVTKKLAQDEAISQVGGVITGACQQVGASHIVTISSGRVSPSKTEAQLCDTLTFINEDSAVIEVSFGSQPEKDNYAGQEVSVRKNYPKSITLNEAGSYSFHNRLDPAASGSFTVVR